MDIRLEGTELVQECRGKTAAPGIEQLPRAPEPVKAPNHRQQRCHADSARDQDGLSRVLAKREIVSRVGDRDEIAGADIVMNELRSAAAVPVLVDCDDVA